MTTKPSDVHASTSVQALLDLAVSAIGGVARAGQAQMAAAVDEACATGRHLLVQAGTGTGKSVAYLVPAIARALAGQRPVVISTATLALQAQIVERDLPRVAEALAPALGRKPTWQLVKGRSNYVCVNKLAGGFPVEDEQLFSWAGDPGVAAGEVLGGSTNASTSVSTASRLGAEVVRLRTWAEQSRSGDRDELVPGVSERAWRQVSVDARECLGSRCPMAGECHSELGRARAHEVDLIVTNHAFVAIDASEGRRLLPEHQLLIIDEAHELADRVTSVATGELSVGMVAVAARRVRRASAGLPATLENAGDALESALEDLPEGRVRGSWPESVERALHLVRDAARELLSGLANDPATTGPDGARQVARAGVSEVLDVAERLVGAVAVGADGADVAWVTRQRRTEGDIRISLHVAPLSVAMRLREEVFGDRTVVLTSATLTIGGGFDATVGSIGLAGKGAPAITTLDVGSPFDYATQGILYIAKHLAPPGREGPAPEFYDELASLVTAAGGRTLGLFSSRRGAQAAAEELRARLDLRILCQGDDATPTLVREFASDAPTCLFGTLSLWQGVDVPGPACQLVVIDRIPFPRPDDPLSSARQEAIGRAGGNGFMAVAGGQAALLLAQGAGRLIRSGQDRGVVAVLDSRLATARYGSYLIGSMPGFWATTDRARVLAALERINASAGLLAHSAAAPDRVSTPSGEPLKPSLVPAPSGSAAGADSAPDLRSALPLSAENLESLSPARPGVQVPGDVTSGTTSPNEGAGVIPRAPSTRQAVVAGRAWTSEEDEELEEAVADEVDLETLSEHFDCSPEQILARCASLGLPGPLETD